MNTNFPSDKVSRSLKRATQALITLAIVSIAIASPASHSSYLFGGLIALVLAFLCALWRIFFQSRGRVASISHVSSAASSNGPIVLATSAW